MTTTTITTVEATITEATTEYGAEVVRAAEMFRSRRDRKTNPHGTFDRAGRFYLADDERCDCCSGIRTPSARFPYSEMVHARTAVHVANMVGAEAKLVKRVAKKLDEAARIEKVMSEPDMSHL